MKVGIFVDAQNISANGGHCLQYQILAQLAARSGNEIIRMSTYLAFDENRAENDTDYRNKALAYHGNLRDQGWKVITKPIKRFNNPDGTTNSKCNSDLDMAVDMLLEAKNYDKVLLATGDGDFVRVARALQSHGCRVEILAFNNVSRLLREEADLFINGHLIPGLLGNKTSIRNGDNASRPWGHVGSVVRGVCNHWNTEMACGSLRILKDVPTTAVWAGDMKQHITLFASESDFLDKGVIRRLPSRELTFEFRIDAAPPQKPGEKEKNCVAREIRLVDE